MRSPPPPGLGLWIAYRGRLGSAADAARAARACGASWVAPRAGDGGLNDAAFRDPEGEIAAYHAEGLKVFPWLYSRRGAWKTQVEAVRRLVRSGADGYIDDAEIAFGGGFVEARDYGLALRDVAPDLWIADAPWPWPAGHPEYPMEEFAAFVDARLPQMYWTEINGLGFARVATVYEQQWAHWESAHPGLVRPRWPIGVTYGRADGIRLGMGQLPPGEVTVADVRAFLDRYGVTASLYSLEAASPEVVELLHDRVPTIREVARAEAIDAPLAASLIVPPAPRPGEG